MRCKNADVTGIDYEILVDDLNEFLHNLQLGLGSTDGMAAAMSMAFALGDAGKCFVSQDKVDEIAYKVE